MHRSEVQASSRDEHANCSASQIHSTVQTSPVAPWKAAALGGMLAVALLAPTAQAQGPVHAAVRGRVALPGGPPAGGAMLLVRDGEGTLVRQLRLGRDGRFVLLRLAPGTYTLDARLPGFTSNLLQPSAVVSLEGGDLAEVDLQFALTSARAASQGLGKPDLQGNQAAVYAEPHPDLRSASRPARPAADLRSEGTSAGTSTGSSLGANRATLQALPLLSRDPSEAAVLDSSAADATSPEATRTADDPSADNDASGSAEATDKPGSGLSYNGLSPTQNSSRQDGLSAEQGFRSGPRGAALEGPRTAASFGQAAVRSLRVFPSTYSAQHGSAGGGVLTFGSQPGTARFHGTLFTYDRQSAWAAINPYSLVQHYTAGAISSGLVRPDDSELQTGASLGFPLAALRIPSFGGQANGVPAVFGSFEYLQRRATVDSSPATPGFYALSPTQVAVLANRGVKRAATQVALSYLDSLSGPFTRTDQRAFGFVRLDMPVGSHNTAGFSFQNNRFTAPSGAQLGSASAAVLPRGRGSLGDTNLTVTAFAGRWLHLFNRRFSHDLRGQWAHDLEYESPHSPLPNEPAISPGGLAPQVSIAPNGFTYGTLASLGRTAYPDEHRIEVADSFLVSFGRHLLTFGGDWSRLDDRIASLSNTSGTFLYDSGSTNGRAGGLVDWITDYTFNVNTYPNGGCPSVFSAPHFFCFRSFTQSFGGTETRFITHEIAAFLEDTLRPAHGLSLTLGVRSDYTLLPIPRSPNRKLDSTFAVLPGAANGSTAVFPEDRNNFGPRLALGWAPRRGRLFTARVGYGVFFGRLPGATVRAALANTALPSTVSGIRIVTTTPATCPQIANEAFGYPCAYTSAPPAAVAATTSATEFGQNFRFPAVQRASFTLERSFRSRFVLSGGYWMSTATQLPISVDRNIAPPTSAIRYVLQGGDGFQGLHTGDTFEVPLYTARLSPSYGPVTALISSANATYHALTFAGSVRGPGWLQLHGNFTFSRAIDYAPQLGATPRLNGRFDPYTPGYDKGLSSLHFPVRFAGNLILRSPLEQGDTMRRKLFGGWRLAAVGRGQQRSSLQLRGLWGNGAVRGARKPERRGRCDLPAHRRTKYASFAGTWPCGRAPQP